MISERRSEFRRGWPTLSGSVLGIGMGITGLSLYSAGLFVADLKVELGLTSTTFGLAFCFLSLGIALGVPVVGYLIDRFGVKYPTIGGALALAACFSALGTVVDSVGKYMLVMGLMGFFGSGSGPIAFTRAVSSWFDRARGLALGITMMGSGISGAVLPLALGNVINVHGWRLGFLTLACVALLGILPTLFLVREAPATIHGSTSAKPSKTEIDHAFAVVRRDPRFWKLVALFALMAVAFTGLVAHLIPMLRQAGSSPSYAALCASLLGVAVILSRLIIGFLFDILEPTRVAAGLCLVGVAGVGAFLIGGPTFAPFFALALGALLGAELDMLAYFTSRYFGLIAFGRAYAGPFMAFMIGSAISPLWIGAVADAVGSYTPALVVMAVLTALCAFSFTRMQSPRVSSTVTATIDHRRAFSETAEPRT